MPTRITLTYHAYKDFEVPNKIAKMIQDGTISWRSRHDDLFYTDENGNEQSVSSIRECVAWEGHDDYEVAESEEESDEEESECCGCQQHGDDGCRCDCHEEDDDVDKSADEREEEVDDVDAPNIFPYKKCSYCGERKSCGNYNSDKAWFCEDCYDEDEEEDEEEEDDDDSVCFRVRHEYNEKECSDNCPHKPEEEPLVEGVDYEVLEEKSDVVWRESACEGPCHADGRCCYRSYKMAEKIEAYYKKSSAE